MKSIAQIFNLENLFKAIKQTYKRFPLPLFFSVAIFIVLSFKNYEIDLLPPELFGKTILLLFQGFIFTKAIQLFSESNRLSPRLTQLLAIGGYALLALNIFIRQELAYSHYFSTASVCLFTYFSPFIHRKTSEYSFWYFNYQHNHAFLIAVISSIIVCAGLSTVLGSAQYLFELRYTENLYIEIWLFGSSLFFPIYFLSLVPLQFDYEKSDIILPRGTLFIANYVYIPLFLIYAIVLYAYGLKILMEWKLPRGNLSYMVAGFGTLGILLHIAIEPMRDSGTRLLRLFYTHFYKSLIVPIILLAIAIYTRISEYGWTEDRYAVVLCLIWFSALALFNLYKTIKIQTKFIPMLLCALAFLASIGPWSAVNVSMSSQLSRLGTLLIKNGIILENGNIGQAATSASFQDRKNISSIVDYLEDRHKLDEISKWTDPFNSHLATGESRNRRIMSAWGLDYVTRWQKEYTDRKIDNFNLSYNENKPFSDSPIKVSPYTYFTTVNFSGSRSWIARTSYSENKKSILTATFEMTHDGTLTLEFSENRKITFPLKSAIEKQYRDKTEGTNRPTNFEVHKNEKGIDVLVRVHSLTGHIDNDSIQLSSVSMSVLFTPGKSK